LGPGKEHENNANEMRCDQPSGEPAAGVGFAAFFEGTIFAGIDLSVCADI